MQELINVIRELSYNGDISLIEDVISKIEQYAERKAYLLSSDEFPMKIFMP